MSENLRELLIDALHQAHWDVRDQGSVPNGSRNAAATHADAVLAVVAPELDRLRAEAADRHQFEMDGVLSRAEQAEAECAVLRERLAKVERLADEWEGWASTRSTTRVDAFRDAAERIRAALASVPEPSEPEVCGFKGCTSEKGHDEKPAADGGAGGQQTAGERSCGHPNHGGPDHDCTPFLPCPDCPHTDGERP